MSSYNNILFPFDSSSKSEEPFSFAIDLAKNHRSNLILLYAHRLDSNPQRNLVSASTLRDEMKFSAEEQLDRLKKTFELDGNLKYEFHPEIGFLASRIILKIKEYPIDLLLLEKRVLTELEAETEQIHCPIMLIPR